MAITIRNPFFKSNRQKNLELAAASFKTAMENADNVETFTPEQAFNAVPELDALRPLTEGEIDFICHETGAQLIRG